MYIPSSKWSWGFLTVTLLQGIIGLALEAYIFGQFQSELVSAAADRQAADNGKWARAIPTQLSLLIFAFLYQWALVYDALSNQNTIQVIGLVLMNFGIVIYTGIQKDQVHEAYVNLLQYNFLPAPYWGQVQGAITALPCLIALFTVVLAFLAWKLYQEFGWKIYKQIGADIRMKRRFLIYQIYIALLKFDFFLFVGFEVQFLVVVQGTQTYEVVLTSVALPMVIILLIIAGYSAQRESLIGTIVALVFYFAALAYFVFKLIRMWASSRAYQYKPARKTLTAFAAMTLLLLIITIVVCIWCASNYGHGLKNHTMKRNDSVTESSHKQEFYLDSYGQQAGNTYSNRPPGGSRMEID